MMQHLSMHTALGRRPSGGSGDFKTYMGEFREWLKVVKSVGKDNAPPMPVFDFRAQNIQLSPGVLEAIERTAAEIKRIKEEG